MEKNNKRQSFKKTISQNKFFSVLLIFSLIFTSFTFFSGIKSVNALEKLKPISETDLIDYVDINYNNNDLDVNFINKTNKKLIGSMKLKSHKNVNEIIKVAPGWSVSMVYEININKKFENYLHEPIFIDMKTNEYINKDYKFVYWGSEERTRINYDEVCETIDINNSTKET